MDILEELKQRGYIEQFTHEKELKEELNKGSVSFYIGIDPTANSMHIGHFVALMVASRLQKAGHRPIILMERYRKQIYSKYNACSRML